MPTGYFEPTVLWRLKRRADGTSARATFIPGRPAGTLVWFLDDTLEQAENFEDPGAAMVRSDELRSRLLQQGFHDIEE